MGKNYVGRAIRRRERCEDAEFKKRKYKEERKSREKKSEQYKQTYKNWVQKLTILDDKRCIVCNDLLNFRNKSGYCKRHCKKNKNNNIYKESISVIKEENENGKK
jgi:hypothetical protein